MKFRPCIDIHNGKVKQIVGGSLKDQGDQAAENFVSEQDAAFYAELYKKAGLKGGHVILLNGKDSPNYEATKAQALQALGKYPGGLQIGGGICPENAAEYLEAGASHVIVTSYVFKNGVISWENLEKIRDAAGKGHLVLDLSCRKKDGKYYIVTDRWQKFTEEIVTPELMERLGSFCDEFLVHAVDVEGKARGVETELAKLLGQYTAHPVTYAGGVGSMADIEELRKAKKNISSVITTNYDQLIEKVLDFKPLVGNDILLSNPYGAVYKIHGCVTQPDKIIITTKDYKKFKERYELIRAQLISLFIHNPIIFIGYGIGDKNIIEILRTIFKYVDSRSEKAKQIQSNFLIVEYERGSTSTEVNDFGIDLGNNEIIQVNKIKTDNFVAIYQALSDLSLPISVMDIRRVETIVRKITEGSEIKVAVADDIDQLDNSEKILYIGTEYKPINAKNLIESYFRIIETKEEIGLKLIEDNTVKPNENFPIFGFSSIYNKIKPREKLEKQQILKITDHIKYFSNFLRKNPEICLYSTPKSVYEDSTLPKTYKHLAIIVSTLSGSMDLDTLEKYLKTNINNLTDTGFRQILCAYDLKRFGSIDTKTLLPDDIEIPKT